MIHDYRYIEEEVAKDIPYDPAHIRVSSDCLDEFNWNQRLVKDMTDAAHDIELFYNILNQISVKLY